MELNKIIFNGKEYEIVDKAAQDSLNRMNEPYLPYPSISKEDVSAYSTTIKDGFTVQNYPYFYFTSTNKDRVLYTKAGNIVLQGMVSLTKYLSNYIDVSEDSEVITIHYGN